MSTAARSRPRRAPRVDRLTTAWMVAALATSGTVIGARGLLPQPLWTSIHVVTLGVLTSSILQWSWYFTRALLHLPATDRRSGSRATARLVAVHATTLGLVAAMWSGSAAGAAAGATVLGALIAWHGLDLVLAARTRLGNRYAAVVRYYVAAAAFLVVGCALAGLLAVAILGSGAPAWLVDARDRITLAHAVANTCGWLGLSVLGTLVTLGPTMLRARIDPAALDRAVRALPWLCGGLAVAATAGVVGLLPLLGAGLGLAAVAAVLGIVVPLGRAARRARPGAVATWTLGAGIAWLAVALVAVIAHSLTARNPADLRAADLPWLTLAGAGGIVQVLVGALSYLMPVVIGGGPVSLRAGLAAVEVAWPARVAARNVALTLLAATTATGAPARAAWWFAVLAAYAVDLACLGVAGARQVRARRALGDPLPEPVAVALSPTAASPRGSDPSGASKPPGPLGAGHPVPERSIHPRTQPPGSTP